MKAAEAVSRQRRQVRPRQAVGCATGWKRRTPTYADRWDGVLQREEDILPQHETWYHRDHEKKRKRYKPFARGTYLKDAKGT